MALCRELCRLFIMSFSHENVEVHQRALALNTRVSVWIGGLGQHALDLCVVQSLLPREEAPIETVGNDIGHDQEYCLAF